MGNITIKHLVEVRGHNFVLSFKNGLWQRSLPGYNLTPLEIASSNIDDAIDLYMEILPLDLEEIKGQKGISEVKNNVEKAVKIADSKLETPTSTFLDDSKKSKRLVIHEVGGSFTGEFLSAGKSLDFKYKDKETGKANKRYGVNIRKGGQVLRLWSADIEGQVKKLALQPGMKIKIIKESNFVKEEGATKPATFSIKILD